MNDNHRCYSHRHRASTGRAWRLGHTLCALLTGFTSVSLCLTCQQAVALPNTWDSAAPVLRRLVLHDFDQDTSNNNLGGETYAWTQDSDSLVLQAAFTMTPAQRTEDEGNALHLSYTLDPQRRSKAGFKTRLNGLDASDYDHLEFWVKGDAQEGYARAFKVGFLRPHPASRERMESGSYVVTGVTDQWRQIRVPLNIMNGIRTWTDLRQLVVTFDSRRDPIKQGACYFDDLGLIKTGYSGPSASDKIVARKKKAWQASLGGKAPIERHIRARLLAWPSTPLVDKQQLPQDSHAFLLRLARDTWRGLDALTDREHGLPLDTIRFAQGSVAPEKSRLGDYTSPTNIGMYILAVVAATELDFITRQDALKKLDKTLSTLERLETFQGFFFNYYDTTSLERTSHFVSSVDSAWLTAGLMVMRMAFPELHERSTRLIEQGDYGWFYDDVEQRLSQGYYVNLNYPSEYHYGLLYTEGRVASLIAIGKGDVPEEHWFKLDRTLPLDYSWQSLAPKSRERKPVRGVEMTGGYYQREGVKYVPSWGGSLFEALMPTLVVDENKYAPRSLGMNNRIHATIHRRFALEKLKYPVWGMSPSSTVQGDRYSEFGVWYLGSAGYKNGVITPHASALALDTIPKAAVANLRKLVELYDIYGEYGLYDAVDPRSGKVAPKYLVLNQGMVFIALANYLKDRVIQRYFAADPIAAKSLPVIGVERFFD